MTTRRERMAKLYGDRMKRRVCIHCEAPAGDYIRCTGCRDDQAKYARHRRITGLDKPSRTLHTST